jgi:hypothetical protein
MVLASAGKSTREIEEMLRGIAPLPVYEPGIRKQPERARTEESAPAPATTAPAQAVPAGAGEIALPGVLEPATQYVPAVPRRTSNVLEAATPETYNFRFSANKVFREKLERLAEVLGVRNPVEHMGELLERAVDCLLERKDPERRRVPRRTFRWGSRSRPPGPIPSRGRNRIERPKRQSRPR